MGKPATFKPWSEVDIAILQERYPTEGAAPLVPIFGRRRQLITAKARALGLRSQRHSHSRSHCWTDEENRLLREQWPMVQGRRQSVARLSDRMKIAKNQLYAQALVLGLSRPRLAPPPWSDAENELLETTLHLNQKTVSARFRKAGYPRSPAAIAMQRNRLGLLVAESTNAYSANRLSQLLGVSIISVIRWIRLDWLKAKPRSESIDPNHGGPGDRWVIYPKDVRRFLLAYTAHVDPSRADKYWLFDLLAGGDWGLKLAPMIDQDTCGHGDGSGFDEMRVSAS